MIKTAFVIMLNVFLLFTNSNFAQGFLKTNGKRIVTSDGQSILLRGINLGNWLVQEGYMMQTSSFANTETELRNKIQDLIGTTNTQEFYKAWNDTYTTKKDIDQIAKWGFNSIRLPLHFAKLISIDKPGVFFEEGFATIDRVLEWCEQNKIYLILDLHAAPGSQNGANISDCTDGQARLWTETIYQDRTVELWKRLAERYANKVWIGGYDLINETVYSFPNGNNTPLWNFMQRITTEIRKVDTNHIIFIEGNWWGTDFNHLPSKLWDNNLVLSFHKYWNETNVGTINYLISLSNNYNVPLWLGETGENSNAWFTECIELMQYYNIGYCFWPYKKIASISGLVTAPVTTEYNTLLNYWKNGGSKPTVEYSKNALFGMLKKLEFDNCQINKDVIDAMFRQVNNYEAIPYAENKVPGVIYSVNYDLGRANSVYGDKIYKNSNNNSDVYNTGWTYRNDGVDIERSLDIFESNGYNVGWIDAGEWLNYTVNAVTAGKYDINFRTSGGSSGGKIQVRIDEQPVGNIVNVPVSGGWQSWVTIEGPKGVALTLGSHKMQLQFVAAGFNLSTIEFVLKTTDVIDYNIPDKFELEQNYPNPFNPTTKIKFALPKNSFTVLSVFDVLGMEVKTLIKNELTAGVHQVEFDASNLAAGIYFCRIQSDNFIDIKKMLLIK